MIETTMDKKETQIVHLVEQLLRKVKKEIQELNLPSKEFRRDYDGVSELTWLVEKMLGNRLADEMKYQDVYSGLSEIKKEKRQ